MTADSIYVEIPLESGTDDVWEATREPDVHERWDLRFTDITYLPSEDEAAPQRFTYATRIGGIGVEGTGESTGTRADDGVRTSTLRFFSDDPRALIREGTGFWRYEDRDGSGTRFLTEYNYVTRGGRLGRLIDRLAFRPLLGWATAWSFDRLRLWVDEGVPPEASARAAVVHAVARLVLAIAFVYRGLVPKLLGRHPDEVALLRASGIPEAIAPEALIALGLAEVCLGLALLALWRSRWPLVVAAVAPLALTGVVAVAAPGAFGGPFDPVAATVALSGIAVCGYAVAPLVPTARRCRRRPSADAT